MSSKNTLPNHLEVIDPRVINFFSQDALSTLNQELFLPDTRPRYSDEILLAFKDLLEKRIADKEKDISRKQKDLTDKLLDKKSNKSYEDGDIGAEVAQDEKILDSDKKVLREMKLALSRISYKTFGICWHTGKLISLEQLLANPVSKFITLNNMRCAG